ncbi:MAG: hypothetical protein EHM14_07190 [Methanothrix sp.]|nr:MAG: hypothetical protein EHM14_07190 [Methanothrix sp.]
MTRTQAPRQPRDLCIVRLEGSWEQPRGHPASQKLQPGPAIRTRSPSDSHLIGFPAGIRAAQAVLVTQVPDARPEVRPPGEHARAHESRRAVIRSSKRHPALVHQIGKSSLFRL